MVTVESALGLWLTSHSHPRMARWVAVSFFGFLAVLSAILVAAGQSHCGCFGRIPLRPEVTLMLDVGVVGLLVTAQIVSRRAAPEPATAGLPLANWLGGGIAIVAVSLATWAAVSGNRLDDAIGRLRGEAVTISPRIKELGTGTKNQLAGYQVSLTNHTSRPVSVVGSSANCSCAIDANLPFVLPPHASRTVPVAVRFAGSPGRFQQSFTLYLNRADQTSLPVRFHGSVVPAPTAAAVGKGPL